ncbi:MAG: TonB family protein [Candidatus Aminicenantales bacterium]
MRGMTIGLAFFAAAILVAAAASANPPSPGGQKTVYNLRLGVCDWTIAKTGDPAAFELAAELGLDGVQVSLVPKGDSLALADPALRRIFIQAARKARIPIASFAIGDLNDVPLKSDPRAEKWLDKGIEIAAAMNVKVILVPFFGKGELRNDPAGIDAVVAALNRLAPKAAARGVVLALESYLSAGDNLKILERVGSPAVQVYYDVANSQDVGYPILDEIRQLGAHIVEVHAKDTKDLYGKGSMDFPAVRKALEDIGYKGWFVLEGTKMPLGVEESVRYDTEYLRIVFGEAGPSHPDSGGGPAATVTIMSDKELMPPKRIKSPMPNYPESELRARTGGRIVAALVLGTDGHVASAKILKSIPALDKAVTEAMRKWVYEPFLFDGRPCPYAFATEMFISVSPGSRAPKPKPTPPFEPASPIHQISPDYPEDARRANVEGTVLMGIVISDLGWVTEVSVLRSVPGLDEAAIAAVKQWQYAVATNAGKPIPYCMTVGVRFSLGASKKQP